MPRDLVPLRVVILRKRDKSGHTINDYPDFNKLPEAVRGKLDWCHAIDYYGIGWHYSRDGFGQGSDPYSQIGGICMPEPFAKAAVEMFPDHVSYMSEREWAAFYDDDAHGHEPEEHLDTVILQAIAAKKSIGLELTTGDINALDADHPSPGVKKNRQKFWKDASEHHAVRLKSLGSLRAIPDSGQSTIPSCCE